MALNNFKAGHAPSKSSQHENRCCLPDLWFDDGDVIISSRIAEHTLRFRVHREILSANSNIWQHRFEACAEPCTDEGVVMDVPVVELPEGGDYWCYFLRALYRGSGSSSQHRFFHDLKALPKLRIEVACGIAVLAHKYAVQWLYDEAIRILGSYYASTLDGLDANIRWHACRSPSGSLAESIRLVQHTLTEAAVFLINAAREVRTPELLRLVPHALYAASLLEVKSLSAGTIRGQPLRRAMFLRREYLRADEHRLCALARFWRLCRKEGTPNVKAMCKSMAAGDEVTGPCCGAQRRLQQLVASGDCVLTRMDPLARSVEHWVDELRGNDADVEKGIICERCMAHIKRHHDEARLKVWNDWQAVLKDWPTRVASSRYRLSGTFQ